MSHEVVKQVDQIAEQLASTAEETENLGKLCVQSVKLIRQAGVMRMLQPTDFGGYAAHPRDFAEAVMAVAKACGSTGWVCGVGGVHPWEMALIDRRLQSEVWAENPDTWIASPYAPQGVVTQTDGGYILNGRWNIFARSGGNAVRKHNPLQRFWRDAHVGLQHAIHIPGTVYHSTALTTMGIEPPPPLRVTI